MYNIFTLNNGLRVVIENIDYVNSVCVGLWVENGSRNENEINNGISHFIEHMFFKGTTNRSAKKIAEDIENVGGQINAFTGKEATCYYVKSLNTHLDLCLDVLSDMLFNSKFSSEDIEKEKGVVIEEVNMSEDSPEDVLFDLHSEAIWGDEPIAYPILGTIENIKGFNRERIVDYINTYYTPANSVISICGKVDMNTIEKVIEKYFGQWKNCGVNVKYSTPIFVNDNLYKEKPIEQIHLSLGIPGVSIGHNDIYTLSLMNNIFGGVVSSHLFQRVREELGLCYNIYSFVSPFNNTGTLNIYTGVSQNTVYEAIEAIQEELEAFCKKGITENELYIAKEQLKGNYILGLESTSSRMFSNGKTYMMLNKINKQEDIINKIDSISLERIENVMDSTFRKGIVNSAFVGNNLDINKIKNMLS